jgi:hypothetical protein
MMKQKKQLIALGVLLAVAAAVWFGQRGGPVVGINRPGFITQNYQPLPVDNPALHWSEWDKARHTEYKSNGRNPFSAQAGPPPVVPGSPADLAAANNHGKPPFRPQGPQPTPRPSPPVWPGNVSFFGYGTVPNGTARLAFVSVDGEVQVLGQGDTLLGRYKIVQINNGNLEFQDLSTGLSSTKALDADKAGAPPA